MVTPRFSPSRGGIETHLGKLIQHLNSMGFEITVLTYAHEKHLPLREENGEVIVFRIPNGWERNPPMVYYWMIKERKNLIDYDLIHVHGSSPLLFWYFPLILINPTTPVYATFHGFERDPVPATWKIVRKIANKLVRGSICIGSFIEGIYGIQCDEISFGGVDGPNFKKEKRDGAIFVGRLEKDTGILEHMESLRILKEEYGISMSLDVCGSGSLQQQLLDFASSNRIDVKFHGMVDNPKSIMNRKRIYLAAGYLSILDALSLGLPVIGATQSRLKTEYLKGILESGAPISIQLNSEGVAREIYRINSDSKLYNSISERSKNFAQQMSWDRVVRTYLRLWKK